MKVGGHVNGKVVGSGQTVFGNKPQKLSVQDEVRLDDRVR